jgi:glycosyltransferase involved in cell wall biosynthesis
MKILHISAAHDSTGAGYAAYNLHLNLRKMGLSSDILFIHSKQDLTLSFERNLFARLKRFTITKLDRLFLLFYRKKKQLYFSPGIFGLNLNDYFLEGGYDIIHLHWVNHGFLDLKAIAKLNLPVIWTMHDFWAITGGCHYFYECTNYMKSCGKCMVLESMSSNDLSNHILTRKKAIYEQIGTRLTFVPISDWVRKITLNSPIVKPNRIHNVIYSGIDTDIFSYINRKYAREKLNLEESKFYILLGATDLTNPAKGVSYAIDALTQIKNESKIEFKLLIFGNCNTSFFQDDIMINLGYINNKNELALIYASSDLLLAPSISEAFGMLMAEAQCVGCPVVAFDGTGPSNIVNHKVTGYLSKVFDSISLVNGIEYVYNNTMDRIQISKDSISKFSIQNSGNEYYKLYNQVLGL